jgi:hypothetical protein
MKTLAEMLEGDFAATDLRAAQLFVRTNNLFASHEVKRALAALRASHDRLYIRLRETTEMLDRLLGDEAVNDSGRPEVAVQVTYNDDALTAASVEKEPGE